MPIDTHIEGDAGQCRATARWLGTVADAAQETSTTVNDARTRSEGAWTGPSGQNFRATAHRLVQDADDASEKARSGSTALTTFAGSVDTAKGAMTRAREIAVTGGLTVAGEVIQDPVAAPAAPAPGAPAMPPAQQTSHDRAVTEAGNQRRAYERAETIATDARRKDEEAERTLITSVDGLASALQTIKTGLTWASRVYGPPASAYGNATKWAKKATELGQRAAVWRTISQNPMMSPARRATAYAGFMKHQSAAARASGNAVSVGGRLAPLLGKPTENVLKFLNANPGQLINGTSAPARGAKAVLGKVPYVGGLVTAFGVGADIKGGRGVGESVARNVVPFAAGTAASTGATAGLVALGVAGGPATLAAVGIGMGVAIGTGWVVDNYGDDIANAAGDAADAVGDAASDAKDWAGDKLGSIF